MSEDGEKQIRKKHSPDYCWGNGNIRSTINGPIHISNIHIHLNFRIRVNIISFVADLRLFAIIMRNIGDAKTFSLKKNMKTLLFSFAWMREYIETKTTSVATESIEFNLGNSSGRIWSHYKTWNMVEARKTK